MATESPVSEATNVELCRRYLEEFVNTGDVAVAEEVLDESVVTHQLGAGSTTEGRDALVTHILAFRDAVPNWHLVVEDAVAQGDRVMLRVTASGTPENAWGKLIPTGRSFETPAFFAFRLVNGRIVEQWNLANPMAIAKQLGFFPPGPGVAVKVLAHRIRSRLGRA